MHKDFLGKTLTIGDEVVCTAKNYRQFVRATIVNLTDKKVLVKYLNTWNYGKPGREEEYYITGSFCVKIEKTEENS